jgi:hypothetical protein
MVEKSGVEKFLFALGLKSSWLKCPATRIKASYIIKIFMW